MTSPPPPAPLPTFLSVAHSPSPAYPTPHTLAQAAYHIESVEAKDLHGEVTVTPAYGSQLLVVVKHLA